MLRRPALRHSLPATLLLGLLALLLWGQCAFHLNDASPPPSELLLHTTRSDSLTAATLTRPATLYLTLDLYNNTPRDLVLLDLRGVLYYRNQRWTWQASSERPLALPVPVQAHRPLAIAIPLVPADSVPALRASLRTARYLPQLILQGAYARRANDHAGRRAFQATDYVQLLHAR